MFKGIRLLSVVLDRAGRFPIGLLGLILFPSLVSAALWIHEDFDYPPGPLSGAQGGTGWSASWQIDPNPGTRDITVVEGTLSYGNLRTSGNRVRSAQPTQGRTGFIGTDPFRCDTVRRTVTALAFSDPGPAVLWMSVLVRIEAADFAAHWFGLKTTASDSLWFGLNANSPFYGMEMPRTDSKTPFSTNSTDLLVVRIERRPDGKTDKHLWINPAPDSLGGADPALETATLTSPGGGSVSSIPGILLHCANAGDLDEIRVGETFADVTPVAAAETAAFSLPTDPDNPRWVNGQPAGELDTVEAEGLRVRTAQGSTIVAPWNLLSPATRYRYQPGFQDRLPDLLKGKSGSDSPGKPPPP